MMTGRLNLRLSVELLKKLQALAAKNNTTVSRLVREKLEEIVQQKE